MAQSWTCPRRRWRCDGCCHRARLSLCFMPDQQWARRRVVYIVLAANPFAGAFWTAKQLDGSQQHVSVSRLVGSSLFEPQAHQILAFPGASCMQCPTRSGNQSWSTRVMSQRTRSSFRTTKGARCWALRAGSHSDKLFCGSTSLLLSAS